jgi:endo-1,3(4)-beta-glucanase
MRRFVDISRLTLKSIVFMVILLAILAFVLFALARNNGINTADKQPDPLLSKYLQRSLVSVNTYDAPRIIAPTNKWFSSLAFQQPSDPIFAWPLALQTTSKGFSLSQPQISASTNTIAAPFTQDLDVTIGDQVTQTVTGYDDLSVSFNLSDQLRPALDIRMTRGSPYLFMNLRAGSTLSVNSASFTLSQGGSKQEAIFMNGDVRYGLVVDKNTTIDVSGNSIEIKAGDSSGQVTIFAIPKNANIEQFIQVATHPITKTAVSSIVRKGKLITTYSLTTADKSPTLFGLLPFANQSTSTAYGSFSTLEGVQNVHRGNSFSFSSNVSSPPDSLSLVDISKSERDTLKQLLLTDSSSLKFDKDDSYYGGKEVYRAAQLLQLTKQLGMTSQADHIQSLLETRLSQWFDPSGYEKRSSRYFYYDNNLDGLVAATPDFGSDAFNDHHFHYGYYLGAASILARYDSQFLHANRGSINLLAKDIMNTDRSDPNFPYIRTFDAYVGHSWASGFGTFSDGQNQESSSEAVNAWYGAYEWGKVSGNSQLESMALTLYTRESQAARSYWLSAPNIPGYSHDIISLVWSGKLDYATFFNNSPDAKIGIQLIPMSPGSSYLEAGGTLSIESQLSSLSQELGGKQPTVFKDYLLMYKAMYDPKGALTDLEGLKSTDIDDADSMSYVHAWVYSHQ